MHLNGEDMLMQLLYSSRRSLGNLLLESSFCSLVVPAVPTFFFIEIGETGRCLAK